MKLATVLERIWGNHHEVTEDEIRGVFGDYHNVLNWLAVFLVEDKQLARACVIDACTIADSQSPVFHEWLVHWAARATFRSAFVVERAAVATLALHYEKDSSVPDEHPPLTVEQLDLLIKNTELIQPQLDILCRFVLVLHGIAKESTEEVGVQLGISSDAVKRAYRFALETLEGATRGDVEAFVA
jgi:DNA-directed RNA polymerase specialized sigma24 family protein